MASLRKLFALLMVCEFAVYMAAAGDIDFTFWMREKDGFCRYRDEKGGVISDNCVAREKSTTVWGACGFNTAAMKIYCCGAGIGNCYRTGEKCDGPRGNDDQIMCENGGESWCCRGKHEKCVSSNDKIFGSTNACVPAEGTNPFYNGDPQKPYTMHTATYKFTVKLPGATYPPTSSSSSSSSSPQLSAAQNTQFPSMATNALTASRSAGSTGRQGSDTGGPIATGTVIRTDSEAIENKKIQEENKKGTPVGVIAGAAVGGIAGMAAVLAAAVILIRRRKQKQTTKHMNIPELEQPVYVQGMSSAKDVRRINEVPVELATGTTYKGYR